MPVNILQEIAAERRARSAERASDARVPRTRSAPLVAFDVSPLVICEVKRRSPSAGDIAPGLCPRIQAGLYADQGVGAVSVLTEESRFGGSLEDLMEVKGSYPRLAVLRKDFLLSEEDIEISYRCGADAVLLIAALHDARTLAALHHRARSLGLAAMVEVHDAEDVVKARSFAPELLGVNARDLASFRVDILQPLRLRPLIDWPCRIVFESGIRAPEDAHLAGCSGFHGLLVGEAVVRDPTLVPAVARAFAEGRCSPSRFWLEIAARIKAGRPLVKICGLTRVEDALLAEALGADVLGFVFADSPRRADAELLRNLPPTRALRVGVAALGPRERELPAELRSLLDQGRLDAVQFHGEEAPELCARIGHPYYKAICPATPEEAATLAAACRSPRVLLDAFSPQARGGSGRETDPSVVAAARPPLWLAGGIGAHNVERIVRAYGPELIDASSRLESSPGRKDGALMKAFFEEVAHAGGIHG